MGWMTNAIEYDGKQKGSLVQCYVGIKKKEQVKKNAGDTPQYGCEEKEGYAIFGTRRKRKVLTSVVEAEEECKGSMTRSR